MTMTYVCALYKRLRYNEWNNWNYNDIWQEHKTFILDLKRQLTQSDHVATHKAADR